MSLYLPEQKLGSHSTEGGSSNKFILKGRQTGAMHRGHTWVFRAESHDTMMAWYEDIKALTEKSPEELSHFVRDHSRSFSRSSQRSISSDGNLDADEDEEPFTPDATAAAIIAANPGPRNHQSDPNRPEPGGRFPSDLEVTAQRGLQVLPLSSPSSASSGILDYSTSEYAAMQGANNNNGNSYSNNNNPNVMNPNGGASSGGMNQDQNVIAAAVAQPGSGLGNSNDPYTAAANNGSQYGFLQPQQQQNNTYGDTQSVNMNQAPSHAAILDHEARQDGVNPYNGQPLAYHHQTIPQSQPQPQPQPQRLNSNRFSYTSDSEALDTTTTTTPLAFGMQQQQPSYVLNGGMPQESQQQQYKYPPATVGGLKQPPAQSVAIDGAAAPIPYTRTQDGQIRPLGAGVRTDSNPHVPGEYPRSNK